MDSNRRGIRSRRATPCVSPALYRKSQNKSAANRGITCGDVGLNGGMEKESASPDFSGLAPTIPKFCKELQVHGAPIFRRMSRTRESKFAFSLHSLFSSLQPFERHHLTTRRSPCKQKVRHRNHGTDRLVFPGTETTPEIQFPAPATQPGGVGTFSVTCSCPVYRSPGMRPGPRC